MDTKFAKPNAVSAELPTMLYCIHCECVVKAEQGVNGLRHATGDWKEEPTFCYFPDDWTTHAPPELPDDWASQEPDDDQKAELEQEETGFWAEVWK